MAAKAASRSENDKEAVRAFLKSRARRVSMCSVLRFFSCSWFMIEVQISEFLKASVNMDGYGILALAGDLCDLLEGEFFDVSHEYSFTIGCRNFVQELERLA